MQNGDGDLFPSTVVLEKLFSTRLSCLKSRRIRCRESFISTYNHCESVSRTGVFEEMLAMGRCYPVSCHEVLGKHLRGFSRNHFRRSF